MRSLRGVLLSHVLVQDVPLVEAFATLFTLVRLFDVVGLHVKRKGSVALKQRISSINGAIELHTNTQSHDSRPDHENISTQ